MLGRYVREEKVLPLELAIHKMTGLSAQQLGLKDRGRIAEGYIADLVIFDPATVIDQSTIEHPEAPPLGIPSVMVSGEWVIDGGAVTGKHPGQVLRSPAFSHNGIVWGGHSCPPPLVLNLNCFFLRSLFDKSWSKTR